MIATALAAVYEVGRQNERMPDALGMAVQGAAFAAQLFEQSTLWIAWRLRDDGRWYFVTDIDER